MLSTYFETINDLLSSFGPVRDCSRNNGGCTRNFKCVADRQVDSSGCVVSALAHERGAGPGAKAASQRPFCEGAAGQGRGSYLRGLQYIRPPSLISSSRQWDPDHTYFL